jgi:hypothetical protein
MRDFFSKRGRGGKMQKSHQKPRRDSFAWQSKQELYDYFIAMYQVERSVVDYEIEEVLKNFQIRQGRPINPQELWEKVGVNLEHRFKKAQVAGDTDHDDDVIDLESLKRDEKDLE